MLRSRIKFLSHRILLAIVLATLMLVVAFVLSPARKVSALPCHEVTHYYYDGPDYANEVGVRYVTCHGVYTFGQVTSYVVSNDGDDCPENCPQN